MRMLSARTPRSLEQRPVTFTAAGQALRALRLAARRRADWRAAVREAAADGDGFGPLRGFRRLRARFFGARRLAARCHAYDAAVRYKLDQIASAVDRKGVDAKLVRQGLRHPGRRGP